MKVSIVVVQDGPGMAPDASGLLVEGLAAAYRRRGLECDVVSLPGRHAPDDGTGAHDEFTGAAGLGDELARRHARSRPDVVHAQGWAAAAAALVARRSVDVPVLARVSPGSGPRPADPLPNASRRESARAACLRAAEAVSVWTHDERRAVVRAGADRSAVFTAVDGAPPAELPGARRAGPPRILAPLGAGADHGAPDLVASLRSMPDARLVVAARADQRREVQNLAAWARRFGVSERVSVSSPATPRDLRRLYAEADAVACVPRVPTGAPAVLAAMSTTRPVVVSDVGMLPDIVADRTTGAVVPSGDRGALVAALRRLLTDPFRSEAWGRAGYDRAITRFDWDVVVAGHEKACRAAVDRAR
jgi:glycosyltransferase involved in cell wall biosynthesis